ncbi:hypothetical protein MLD38_023626 [Melastoma candidum]|uniref:Uncharacterized protein n=1 Tax=Melastoma candidum TaxID=119954 RepID=A0ACB9NQ92_9MYRT|nr:hypothetical protein MLD38_023626 [Melastoma candidum]
MSSDSTSSRTHPNGNDMRFESRENDSDPTSASSRSRLPRSPLHVIQVSLCDAAAEGISRKEKTGGYASLLGSSSCNVTPRVSKGKALQDDASSAHSTPARAGSRVSLGIGRRFGGRIERNEGVSGARECEEAKEVEVPYFDLEEDDSFWNDRNVQVLIRIRPLSYLEKVSQGNGRCLRQESPKTLVWQGNPETRLTFDQVACEKISQEKLFRVAGLPMVQNCLSGYNSCIFAYGQTGSGKTYTMMGDISEVEERLSDDCGITPRIFEYIFTRIRSDEESRKDENLMYRCKCSFLEIYNEHITDLLEPSSVNLQLREDTKKGVFVEDLTEYNVWTVKDVIKLLRRGAANRKMAATHMNSESSRSHSVFTCTIESHWEKDSMTHLRFARLNLVDLAGSERLVIMSLVDLAHGRHRHVPYRDSRLTFLLQDSLGGNSKTMIIANVSPSIGSASETLGTLKFAQRAKLIQNNAKVNEDASGNVNALQRQIEQLKDQLSFLMKTHGPPQREQNAETSPLSGSAELDGVGTRTWAHNNEMQPLSNITEMKSSGVTLVGSLRGERDLQQVVEKLQDEIESLKLLVRQKDEEANQTRLTLKLCEDAMKRQTLLKDGDISADVYLLEQNKAVMAENHLLQERINRNPELIQLSLRNTQLAEELQVYRTFYEQGEREHLLAEVSNMRTQLLGLLEGNSAISRESRRQELKDLEDCQEMNARLMRELNDLRTGIQKDMQSYRTIHDSFADSLLKDPEDLCQAETSSLNDSDENTMTICTQGVDETWMNRSSQIHGSDSNMQREILLEELAGSKGLNKAFQSEHLRLIRDLQDIQEENETLGDMGEKQKPFSDPSSQPLDLTSFSTTEKARKSIEGENVLVEARLEKIVQDLQTILVPNQPCSQEDQMKSTTCPAKSILEQADKESRTTLLLLDELTTLQQELCLRLRSQTEENERLDKIIAAKEEEITVLTADWEKATLELTSFLIHGSKSLKDATSSVQSIAFSFPNNNVCISEQLKRAAGACIKKEEAISLLQESLENAQKAVQDLELKLTSLREVTETLHESQNSSGRTNEAADLIKDMVLKLEKESDDSANTSEECAPGTVAKGAALSLELEHGKAAEVAWGWEEIKSFMSHIELHSLHVQRNVEEMFHVLHLNAMSMQQDLLSLAGELKSLMESFSRQIRESPFCLHSRLQHLLPQLPSSTLQVGTNPSDQKAYYDVIEGSQMACLSEHSSPTVIGEGGFRVNDKDKAGPRCLEANEERDGITEDGSVLRNELERKDIILQGLLFDLSLLQEAASDQKDIKDKTSVLLGSLTKLKEEVADKTRQLDGMMSEKRKLVERLADSEKALAISISESELYKETTDALSLQIDELRTLLKDIYLKKSKAEEQLNEQKEIAKVLEEEIIHLTSSRERTLLSPVDNIQDHLKMITCERDQLLEEVRCLNNKLDLANLLADEKEAIAAEACQESEASKLYAEQREAEVKILENSVEELEQTIDALEKKVCEMDQDVERHKLIRDSQELELAALKSRLAEVESLPRYRELRAAGNLEGQVSSEVIDLSSELSEAIKQIKLLEEERSEQEREIIECKEYISELVLHAEAQASQYQQKYKDLEDMACELRTDLPKLASTALVLPEDKHDVISRRRGSSSPFRCISSLLQQANMEKEQELSATRLRLQELETLTSSQQEEVYVLKSRLAAAESMTHDVIRDLLGVRLDMSKYADLVEQLQMQKLVENAYLQREDYRLKEQEVFRLRKQIQHLAEEKESCIRELNHKEADFLAVQMALEQFKRRDQLLSAQNEMLKRDKTNLNHKVAELDDMVGKLLGTNTQKMLERKTRAKENSQPKMGAADSSKRLSVSEKFNSYVYVGDQVLRHQSPRRSSLPDKKSPLTSRPLMRKQNVSDLQ